MLDCVIPAAGESQRMGRWKPALRWGDGWVIDAVVASALAAETRVIVVVRAEHSELLGQRFARLSRVRVVVNHQAQLGMFSSIQRGVREVQSQRFYVLPADMPLVPAAVFQQLRNAEPCAAVRPAYRGQPGHPVLLNREVAERVVALPPDAGMQRALCGVMMRTIDTDCYGVSADIDTPRDYRQLQP